MQLELFTAKNNTEWVRREVNREKQHDKSTLAIKARFHIHVQRLGRETYLSTLRNCIAKKTIWVETDQDGRTQADDRINMVRKNGKKYSEKWLGRKAERQKVNNTYLGS